MTTFGIPATMMQEKVDVHILSPTELALEMINAGLTNKHIGLRLMACHGGQGYHCISATGKQLKYFLHHK